jgi:hypothetical protein
MHIHTHTHINSHTRTHAHELPHTHMHPHTDAPPFPRHPPIHDDEVTVGVLQQPILLHVGQSLRHLGSQAGGNHTQSAGTSTALQGLACMALEIGIAVIRGITSSGRDTGRAHLSRGLPVWHGLYDTACMAHLEIGRVLFKALETYLVFSALDTGRVLSQEGGA